MGINKEQVRENFSKSAADYDAHADLQNEIIAKLFSFLSGDFKRILDIGSGTGTLIKMLIKKYPRSVVIGVDLAPGMVKVAVAKVPGRKVKFLVGDGEKLPFKNGDFDLVVSSSSIQWMTSGKVFREVARVLKPKGIFYFATFGPLTLTELKKAGLSVNSFPDKTDLKKSLAKYFKKVIIRKKIIRKHYHNIFELFRYLKKIGAQYSSAAKNTGLLTKKQMFSLFPAGEVTVTFEVYFGFCNL